jgi:phosphoserine phosphatase
MARLSAVVFDLDGTLVRYHGVEFESSWGAVAAGAGVGDASRALLAEYLPRRDAYAEWVSKDAALLAGVPVARVAERLFPPPYADGVAAAIERLRGRYRLGILSSGIDLVADWVRDDLRFDFALANHLEVVDGRFTGASVTRVELWNKEHAFRSLLAEHGLTPLEVCYVGDHVNDVPVMKAAGLAIAANPKDASLLEVCDHVIRDFSALPALVDAFSDVSSGSRQERT